MDKIIHDEIHKMDTKKLEFELKEIQKVEKKLENKHEKSKEFIEEVKKEILYLLENKDV